MLSIEELIGNVVVNPMYFGREGVDVFRLQEINKPNEEGFGMSILNNMFVLFLINNDTNTCPFYTKRRKVGVMGMMEGWLIMVLRRSFQLQNSRRKAESKVTCYGINGFSRSRPSSVPEGVITS